MSRWVDTLRRHLPIELRFCETWLISQRTGADGTVLRPAAGRSPVRCLLAAPNCFTLGWSANALTWLEGLSTPRWVASWLLLLFQSCQISQRTDACAAVPGVLPAGCNDIFADLADLPAHRILRPVAGRSPVRCLLAASTCTRCIACLPCTPHAAPTVPLAIILLLSLVVRPMSDMGQFALKVCANVGQTHPRTVYRN